MSARKALLLAGAAALLLVAGSLALLDWMEGPAQASSGPTDAPVAGGATGPGATAGGAPSLPEAPPDPLPLITAPDIGARPSAAAIVPWDQVPMASRLGELGRELAAPTNAALKSARATIESCFEEDRQLRAKRPAPIVDPDNPPTGPAVLVLQLESRAGGLDVVAATVESLGTSTRELADCACQVLRGWPIPAPAATAGRRYRLKYSLL